MNFILVWIGKFISWLSRILGRGHGSTWPGHLALSVDKNIIQELLKQNPQVKIILIAGTNGKTTTGKLLQNILQEDGKKVFLNSSGANLLNGIASALLLRSNLLGKLNDDYAVFEVDENSLPMAVKACKPAYILLLNLFRDQLDRYGEIDSIVQKWKKIADELSENTTLVLNANDPQIAYLGSDLKAKTVYFGLAEKTKQKSLDHASDSTYCPYCGTKLEYTSIYFSHLGNWACSGCKRKQHNLDQSSAPLYPLAGMYNKYNTHAAILTAKQIGVSEDTIKQALEHFSPAFGRQEKIELNGKNVQIFLSKNPTSFNQSLRTIMELQPKHLLFILNDRIPDGRDVSWIWDTDIEKYSYGQVHVMASGDRAFDMAIRLKYSHPAIKHVDTFPWLEKALPDIITKLPQEETLYILPTYSAMLEARRLLTGKKIL